MADNWQFLRSRPGSASWNMAMDEALLLRATVPTLRLYSWTEPAATFGYFQKYDEVARATELRPLIRRCTGGGIVPHDCDWTYSLVFPNGTDWYSLKAEDSYRRAHEWVSAAFGRLRLATQLAECCEVATPGKCFAGFEKHDVVSEGRKIAGAAQRRMRSGLLIQGSVQAPDFAKRADWERAFMAEAEARFGIAWGDFNEESIRSFAAVLEREKYAGDEHNRRR